MLVFKVLNIQRFQEDWENPLCRAYFPLTCSHVYQVQVMMATLLYCFMRLKVFWCAVCAVLFNMCAVGLWAVQFYQKLQQNVLSQEDRDNQWSSANMAYYGYSFW